MEADISVLPSLPEESHVILKVNIINQGVESKDDLKYIRIEDIV